MNIQTRFNVAILTTTLLLTGMVSCQSHEQRGDEAFDRVKDEKSISDNKKEVLQEPAKFKSVTKPEVLNAWGKFTADMEAQIKKNEQIIRALKSTPDAASVSIKKVIRLEKSNQELREQMMVYREEERANQEKFIKQMNEEVKEIKAELNNLTK